jgi:hypothetical protein
MPSQKHEAMVLLFRNRPALAAELLRETLGIEVPLPIAARLESAALTEVQPAEYRADLVILLGDDEPLLGIIVEVQLSDDGDKRFAWPSYVANLRARLRRPVYLRVVTVDETTARWASQPIELGGGNVFRPLVLGPSGVPAITDEARARADPELAVLSAMAHGRDADAGTAARIASAAVEASLGLDADRAKLYFDLAVAWLSKAARRELRAMDPAKYEYQSEWVRQWLAEGKAEGRAEGKAEGKAEGELAGRAKLLTRQLNLRFGPLSDKTHALIASATIDELDAIGECLLTAKSLGAALGQPRR